MKTETRGRKPRTPEATITRTVRYSHSELQEIASAAKAEGLDVSAYIRRASIMQARDAAMLTRKLAPLPLAKGRKP